MENFLLFTLQQISMRPKLATSAIIVKNGKVLLIKRKRKYDKNKLACPGGTGGFKEFSEPEKAVAAEVKYDLDVKFTVKKFLKYSVYKGRKDKLIFYFIGSIDKNPSPNGSEVKDWDYYSKEDFKKLKKKDFAFDDYDVLKEYFSL